MVNGFYHVIVDVIVNFTGTWEVRQLHQQWWRWVAEDKCQNDLINPHPHYSLRHLAFILGFDNSDDMNNHANEDTLRTISQMCGPNGYAVYKILLARAIEREENKHAE